EGVDQTRGWFFTLHAIGTMVFASTAYKAVISNGLVLDKEGNKMSKRLGNAVNPFEAIDKYGSDPLRWYMISNSAPWDNLKFDSAGVQEVARKLFATLYNTYSFFALYANVDGFDVSATQIPLAERPEIDRWIISLLNTLVRTVDEALADYEPTRAARAINDFVNDNLSNWYVRLNRKRFWGGGMTPDKVAAYQTLYQCLTTVARLMAPFSPFYSDRLYRDLTAGVENAAPSVHLALFPTVDESAVDASLEQRMATAQTITSMVLALRRKVNIKVRQPLQALMIPVLDNTQRDTVISMKDLLMSELNVKNINIVNDEDGVLVKRIKPDFKKLGPKFGKAMKAVANAIQNMTQQQIAALERIGSCTLEIEGMDSAELSLADVEVISEDIPGWLVANEGNITVALDVTVTDELRREGIARDIVNRIQNIRKSRDYDITDKIALIFADTDSTTPVIEQFGEYIGRQVLASEVKVASDCGAAEDVETFDIDDTEVSVMITKV
ncbi:MAG: class I tRNA ligase family protein, partial [Muribaculaceae bacterium]|nr:class I tRNA ligase family protein [Muribaculaceae bacterium]